MRRSCCLFLVVTLTASAAHGADAPAADTAEDEKLLKAAKVPTDGPGLLEYFKKRTPADADRERVADLIKQLGSDSFAVRHKASTDLVALGPAALAPLRRALNDPDEEVKQRARDCMAALLRGRGPTVSAAAVRLLRARKPAAAVAVLLAYLPSADDETVEEEVLITLTELGARDGKLDAVLPAALQDKAPARRAAAALIVGRSGTAEQKSAVQALLADADAKVRFRAAQGLLAGRDKAGVPALIALLADGPMDLAYPAEDLLLAAAGPRAPKAPLSDNANVRRRCRDSWNGWWKAYGGKLDLAKAEVDLPWLNPTQQVRDVARKFLAAAVRGDVAALKRLTDAPFYFTGQVFSNRQDLDRELEIRGGGHRMPSPPPSFTLTGLSTADDYLKTAQAEEKNFFGQVRKNEVRVVLARGDPGGGVETVSIFVRTAGGRCRVIGISNPSGIR